MKTGVIDIGGGLKDVYGSGVLDRCLDENIHFDVCMGISAGSANLSTFLANQKKGSYYFYVKYMQRKQSMGIRNIFAGKGYMDLNYVYGTLCNQGGEAELDYNAICDDPSELYMVATNAKTGEVHYFSKDDYAQNNYRVLMASSAIPIVSMPYNINGELYYDGYISDCIPIEKMLSLGCEKIVLILSRPLDMKKNIKKYKVLSRLTKHKYPKISELLLAHASIYNEKIELAKKYQEEGRLLIVSPEKTNGVGTIAKDISLLNLQYEAGYNDAAKIINFMNSSK